MSFKDLRFHILVFQQYVQACPMSSPDFAPLANQLGHYRRQLREAEAVLRQL